MRKITLLIIAMLFSAGIKAQEIDSLLTVYSNKMPQENIYVHFDNSIYLPGQTIYFKAYLLRNDELSSESKVLYVDWLDNDGILIDRTVSPIRGFTWSGSYTVPSNYKNQKLHALVHTKWMLNFDSAFIFRCSFPIVQNTSLTDTLEHLNFPNVKLNFFPEGGSLVEGLTCTVAFKAVNDVGMPTNISGYIYNKSRQTRISFATVHDGMGMVKLKAESGETYFAEWTSPSGKVFAEKLPEAVRNSIAFSVNTDSGAATITVERGQDPSEKLRALTLIGTCNQKLVFKAAIDLKVKTFARFALPVSKLPTGILVLTVLDNNMVPLTERIIFNQNDDHVLPIRLYTDTIRFEKRSRNSISIELSDSVESSLSVSITAGDGFHDTTENIISGMLLTSELKGKIFNPAFYFSQDTQAKKYLDLVMLTNGWRKFKWQHVIKGSSPEIAYPEENYYINLVGNIGKSLKGHDKKEQTITLIKKAKTGTDKYSFIPIKADGNFIDSNLLFYDTLTVRYQVAETIVSNPASVTINSSILPFKRGNKVVLPNKWNYNEFQSNERYYNRLTGQQQQEELSSKTTLANVTVYTKAKTRIDELDELYTSNPFKNATRSFDILNDRLGITSATVISYLQNRASVAGLTIDNMGRFPTVTWRAGGRKNDALTAFFLDERQVAPAEAFRIPMADIAYIKVFAPPFSMAKMNGPGGAVALYTKKGGDLISDKGLSSRLIEGFSREKEFYTPTYDLDSKSDQTTKDLRQTLLWKPDILTDTKTKIVSLVFFNNDSNTSYVVTIEGISSDGRLIHLIRYLNPRNQK